MPSLLSLAGPFGLATFLAVRGFSKRSLSPSGAAAAFGVGFLMMSVPLRVFGVTMIVFYLAGSKATKVGASTKKKLEEGHEEEGYRNAWQVLCNSFTALIASVVWAVLFAPGSLHATLIPYRPTAILSLHTEHTSSSQWCRSVNRYSPTDSLFINRALLFATLGHFATCLGDTLASELGILSPPTSPPRLVTAPWRKVPPGTNGGMSVVGTLASVGGGVVVGLTMAIDLMLERATCLLLEDSSYSVLGLVLKLAAFGGAAGFLGSYIDSLLGATLQRTRYSEANKKILLDEGVNTSQTADDKAVVISGLNLLSNNQVNFISSLTTAALFGIAAFNGIV